MNEVGGGAAEDKDEIAHSLRLARLGYVKVPVFINRHFLTLCRYSFIKKIGTYNIGAGFFFRTNVTKNCRFYIFPPRRGRKSSIGASFNCSGTTLIVPTCMCFSEVVT